MLLEGALNPILLLGGVLPNNVYVDCPLFEIFLELFSCFFSWNFVSAILEICLELEFFLIFFATFVAVLFTLTKVRFDLWKTFSHIFAFIHLFSISVNLVWGDIVHGKLDFFLVSEVSFVLLKHWFYGFIRSIRHVLTWRGGGEHRQY